ncbi:MAG: hypothetical protein MJY78_08800 [Fibrobacter sp.]|nr:hypothetical protein [Fibrobacter sp.]
MKKILMLILMVAVVGFAADATAAKTAANTAPATAIAAPVAADSVANNAADSIAAPSETDNLKAEIALRDSLMAEQGNSCKVEKDSLRQTIESEQAKSANWEKSYNTLKQENDVCTKALGVSIDISEKNKQKAEDEKKNASMMTSTSFIGGIAIGMLLFWLIFD